MFHLSLANWTVGFTIEPPDLSALLVERYAAFACEAGGSVDLHVAVTSEIGSDEGQSILQAELRSNGEDYLLDGSQFYGIIGPLRGQAALRLRSAVPAREVEYFLRVALALFAWSRGGLLVHSAAVKSGEDVLLFTGQSGSGKSTVVALSRAGGRGAALSDDLVILRPSEAAWRAYGTPFWNLESEGREAQTASGQVRAIYKLIQDRDVFVEPMSGATAAAELLANCPIVNSQPALLPELLLRCREVARAVAVRKLHFRKDDAFWEVISC